MTRKDGSRMYATMRSNNGGFAGGAWSNKKENRRKARKIVKRHEDRQWKRENGLGS